MTTTLPRRVSVIVPTRDRPEFLRQALASIRALEGDAYKFEILVGDNGSAVETPAIAEEFGAIYIKVDRAGAGAARNAGLSAATGDYIAFLDDDDVWLPTHLKQHFEILDAQPDVEAIIGQVIHANPELSPYGSPIPDEAPSGGDELLKRMLSGFFPQIGTIIVRAHVRSKVGLFDEALIGGQDLDWMLRIARRRTLNFLAVPCVYFRIREYGTYDALQLKRVGFDRRVFLRHALAEWQIWKSPAEFTKAYKGTLHDFYWYFLNALVVRVRNGNYREAARAFRGAFYVFPLHAIVHIFRYSPLRQAIGEKLFKRPLDAAKIGSSKDS